MMDYTALKVGDQVAIARPGTWSTMNEGVYTVIKANKIKIVVQRDSDGYQRVFSVKRRCESKDTDRYSSAYLEPVAEQEARVERRRKEAAVTNAWLNAEKAAARRDLGVFRQAVAALEALVDPLPF